MVQIAFLASLGVCLSLIARNTLWANFTMALMLLLVFVGSWVILIYTALLTGTRPVQAQRRWYTFSEYGLNPPRTWWHMGFNYEQFTTEVERDAGLFRGSYGGLLGRHLDLRRGRLGFLVGRQGTIPPGTGRRRQVIRHEFQSLGTTVAELAGVAGPIQPP